MNDREVREWYRANGMAYVEDDWGPLSDTGESDGKQSIERERLGGDDTSRRVLQLDTERVVMYEDAGRVYPLWHTGRTPEERKRMEQLEDFLLPYIALLPRPKGELLRSVMNDQLSFEDVPGYTDRHNARRAVKRALRALIKVIAADDPQFTPPPDGRRRDHDAEMSAARRVFKTFLIKRGYSG